MFPQITPDQFEAIKIMLTYFVALSTVYATVATILHILEVRAIKRVVNELAPKRSKQMINEDLEHIDQALDIANS